MDVPAVQQALAERGLDAWLLYDFRGQNPTAVSMLGLGGQMLTRRWFYLIPARGTPTLLVQEMESRSFPPGIPGERWTFTSWPSLHDGLRRLLAAAGGPRIAMEYCPMAAI